MKKSTFYWFVAVVGVVPMLFCTWLWIFASGGSCSLTKSAWVEQELLAIKNILKTYIINAGRPPTTAQGLEVLVSEPTIGPKPKRWTQVMKKLRTDPWGTPYRYTLLTPKEREWRWELRCAGPDGIFGSADDMVVEEESGGVAQAGEKEELRPSF